MTGARGRALALAALLALGPAAGLGAAPAEPRQRTSRLEDSPGYYPPQDPESSAHGMGRRVARIVDGPLAGGERSLEDLAVAFVAACRAGDLAALRRLCVTEEEFFDILWPEFPQSRPATGTRASDAWFVLAARLENGLRSAVGAASGRDLVLLKSTATRGTTGYMNFRLHDGLELRLADERGRTESWTVLRTVVERGGKFKIYSMKD